MEQVYGQGMGVGGVSLQQHKASESQALKAQSFQLLNVGG